MAKRKPDTKRLESQRRWDQENKHTGVCPDCGTLTWMKYHSSNRCVSCTQKLRPRDEHGNFISKETK